MLATDCDGALDNDIVNDGILTGPVSDTSSGMTVTFTCTSIGIAEFYLYGANGCSGSFFGLKNTYPDDPIVTIGLTCINGEWYLKGELSGEPINAFSCMENY